MSMTDERLRAALTRPDGPNDFSLVGLAQQRMQELGNTVEQVVQLRVKLAEARALLVEARGSLDHGYKPLVLRIDAFLEAKP